MHIFIFVSMTSFCVFIPCGYLWTKCPWITHLLHILNATYKHNRQHGGCKLFFNSYAQHSSFSVFTSFLFPSALSSSSSTTLLSLGMKPTSHCCCPKLRLVGLSSCAGICSSLFQTMSFTLLILCVRWSTALWKFWTRCLLMTPIRLEWCLLELVRWELFYLNIN